MSDPSAAVREGYEQRTAQLRAEGERAARVSARLALARGIVFLIGLSALVRAGWPGAERAVPVVVLAAAALGFIALVRRHEQVEQRRAELALRTAFNREGVARLDRRWEDLPVRGRAPDPDHPYAGDLGVSGHASLMHLIGGWCTPLGAAALERWLAAPAPPGEIAARQEATAALAPLAELRETLGARARPLEAATPQRFDAFLAWAAADPWFTAAPSRVWAARGITALIWIGIALHAGGVVGWAVWLPPVAAGWVLTALWRGRVHDLFTRADPGRRLFGGFPALFDAALRAPAAGRLEQVRAGLTAGPRSAAAAIERLDAILAAADARHMWLHFVLQSLTLWDFHVAAALERWQRESGAHAGEWLTGLGDLEALAALAMLRHEHPAWVFPSVSAAHPRTLEASSLMHPLLPPGQAVGNDVSIGPPGRVLVITGSNMSGKSTLLRAAGLNAVLAQAGGPVAAAALRMPPLAIATCMRVEDSLAGGVSYFMAELLRLRRVAQMAERAAAEGEAALYLIDEILQGTNTAERRVAAVHVIERLVRSGAIGAVTTHDLDLADAPELRASADEVHFEERVDERSETMSFDYRLRPGRAASVNALRLMRMVGL